METKKKRTKSKILFVRVHPKYEEKLIKRSMKDGDDNASQTHRKILYAGLDKE